MLTGQLGDWNVWEWTNDWYEYGYYATSPSSNPLGPNNGTVRVLRGGSLNNVAFVARSAYRLYGFPSYRSGAIGFRLARTP